MCVVHRNTEEQQISWAGKQSIFTYPDLSRHWCLEVFLVAVTNTVTPKAGSYNFNHYTTQASFALSTTKCGRQVTHCLAWLSLSLKCLLNDLSSFPCLYTHLEWSRSQDWNVSNKLSKSLHSVFFKLLFGTTCSTYIAMNFFAVCLVLDLKVIIVQQAGIFLLQ